MKVNNKSKIYQNVALVTQIGITMVITIGGGILLGSFIDKKLGTNSVFLAIFTVISVLAAFMNLYNITTRDLDRKGK